ncbi:MAG: hypothetical protein ACI89J_000904 [Hyphomicrobiaceae bacterium]|jgi:hypothetical protein
MRTMVLAVIMTTLGILGFHYPAMSSDKLNLSGNYGNADGCRFLQSNVITNRMVYLSAKEYGRYDWRCVFSWTSKNVAKDIGEAASNVQAVIAICGGDKSGAKTSLLTIRETKRTVIISGKADKPVTLERCDSR